MFRSLIRLPRIGGLTSFGARYLTSISHARTIQFGQPSFIIPAFLQPQQPSKIPNITTPQTIIGNLVREIEQENVEENTLHADSVKRKRKLKMKKHKLRKRRRSERALKKRLGNQTKKKAQVKEKSTHLTFKTMSQITFVTGNANKLKEVVAILSSGSSSSNSDNTHSVGKYTIVNQSLDLDELQGTIEEVTIHKARAAADLIKGPVLVEDTCLGFNAYNNLPGPYIKWFLKSIGLQGLVQMLSGFEDKSANAICTFGYCQGPGFEVKLFQGITEGEIVSSRGPTDFGWDSVFQPKGFDQTYAEMEKSVKNTISHRYRALDKVREFLLAQE
ncbi:Inosine triphosphate pyrophosphatase [Spathaspora sp. JA1]|nr:Inosine triphosphate pyrophosphatase [Spathaspora sp. JA1]